MIGTNFAASDQSVAHQVPCFLFFYSNINPLSRIQRLWMIIFNLLACGWHDEMKVFLAKISSALHVLVDERRSAIFTGCIGQDCADNTIILHAEAIWKTAGPHKKRGVVALEKLASADFAFRTSLWFPLRSTWPICLVCLPVNFCAAPAAAAAPSLNPLRLRGCKAVKSQLCWARASSQMQFYTASATCEHTERKKTRLWDTLQTGCFVFFF